MEAVTNSARPANDSPANNDSAAFDILSPNATRLTWTIWTYGGMVLLLLGSVGNGLSVAVMWRKKLRQHTTAFFLIILAVVDTAVLYNWFVRYWVLAVSGIDTRLLSAASCKLHTFLSYFLVDFESWILVSVSLERLVAVFVPHRAKMIYTKRTASIQLAAIGLILLAANLHFFWTQDLKDHICDVVDKRYFYFAYVWNWFDFVLCSFAPFFLMLSFNVVIISRLVYLKNRRHPNANRTTKNSMTFILLSVTFVFFLTTGPLTILISSGMHWVERAKTRQDLETLSVVWASLNITAYANNAINFLLYCLSGPSFRKELAEMLRIDNCRRRVLPTESASDTLILPTVQASI